MRKRWWAGGLIFMTLAGCRGSASGPQGTALMNKPAPDFELTALDGGVVKLSEFRGKPVLITFFGYG